MIEFFELTGPLAFELDSRPFEAPADAEARAAWAEHCARHPGSFDGEILALANFDGARVVARPARYRHWIHERSQSESSPVRLRPLAVTARMRTAGGEWVLAQRSPAAPQDGGLLELAPAGIHERASGAEPPALPLCQLEQELREELGVEPACVRRATPRELVTDHRTGVFDIVFDLELTLDADELRQRFERRESREYVELRLVDAPALPELLAGTELAPVTRAILEKTLRERGPQSRGGSGS